MREAEFQSMLETKDDDNAVNTRRRQAFCSGSRVLNRDVEAVNLKVSEAAHL